MDNSNEGVKPKRTRATFLASKISLHEYVQRDEVLKMYDKAHDLAKVDTKRNLVPLSDYLERQERNKDKKVGYAFARRMTAPRNSQGVWVGAK